MGLSSRSKLRLSSRSFLLFQLLLSWAQRTKFQHNSFIFGGQSESRCFRTEKNPFLYHASVLLKVLFNMVSAKLLALNEQCIQCGANDYSAVKQNLQSQEQGRKREVTIKIGRASLSTSVHRSSIEVRDGCEVADLLPLFVVVEHPEADVAEEAGLERQTAVAVSHPSGQWSEQVSSWLPFTCQRLPCNVSLASAAWRSLLHLL